MDDNVFQHDRRLLFSIAYRMLGSASDAEDVLQDAWLRYRGAERSTIRSPKAFAATIVTRLCLDRLKSARTTREEYIGPWLPEPVLTSELENPAARLQRAESVTLAFLVLLEKLSPEERAVFVLKDIFEYDHSEIADMLGTTADNSRQLLHRAKARRPLVGRDQVVNFLIGLHRTAQTAGLGPRDISLTIEDVNSEPALVLRVGRRLESIFVFSIDDDAISGIRVVRNPDKLAHIDRKLTTLQ